MPSRMEKYYNNSDNANSRSSRNSNLYNNLYDGGEYSNVEGIATIEKKDEVDIDKIRELLRSHEELKNGTKPVVKRQVQRVSYEEPKVEERNYDIMDVLTKAKDDYEDDNKSRSLKNTQYNILKNINIKEEPLDNEESLKELINTITNTSVLNKLGDKDLSLNLLDDLKSSDNTMIGAKGTNDIFKTEIESSTEEHEMDKSFYTSSLNFGEKDFEQLNDIKHSLKKNNVLITILVLVVLVIVIGGILFVLYNLK